MGLMGFAHHSLHSRHSFRVRSFRHCDDSLAVFGDEIAFSASSPRPRVRYSARELSKAGIVAIVYGGYNSIQWFRLFTSLFSCCLKMVLQ